MKKRNLILSSAVALAFGLGSFGAQATTVTTGTLTQIYATELFQGSTPNTVQLTLPTLNIVAGTPLTAGNYQLYIQASGAAWNTAPVFTIAVANTVVTAVGAAAFSTSTATYGPLAAGTSTADFLSYTFTIGAGQQITAGTVIGTIPGAKISNASASLGAATPAPVTVVATIQNGVATAPVTTGVNTALSAPNIVDATSTPTTVATSALGITGTSAAATSAGQIDLAAASGSATKFNATAVSTTSIKLGTVKYTNGTALTAASAAYAIAGGDTLTGTVTAPAGFFAPLGTTGNLWVTTAANLCTTMPGAGPTNISQSAAFTTAALAAAATSVPLAAGANPPVSGTTYHLCMSVNGTTAIIPGTPSAAFTLVKAAGTAVDSNDVVAATPMFALAYNAQVVDVINYVPVAVGTGWQQYLRIVNTGSVDATVSAAIIDEATGVAGTSVVIPAVGTLKKGAAMTITSQQIEAAVGAIAATARPRIRITAPTNGLTVQNMLFTPNGGFTNNSSTQ